MGKPTRVQLGVGQTEMNSHGLGNMDLDLDLASLSFVGRSVGDVDTALHKFSYIEKTVSSVHKEISKDTFGENKNELDTGKSDDDNDDCWNNDYDGDTDDYDDNSSSVQVGLEETQGVKSASTVGCELESKTVLSSNIRLTAVDNGSRRKVDDLYIPSTRREKMPDKFDGRFQTTMANLRSFKLKPVKTTVKELEAAKEMEKVIENNESLKSSPSEENENLSKIHEGKRGMSKTEQYDPSAVAMVTKPSFQAAQMCTEKKELKPGAIVSADSSAFSDVRESGQGENTACSDVTEREQRVSKSVSESKLMVMSDYTLTLPKVSPDSTDCDTVKLNSVGKEYLHVQKPESLETTDVSEYRHVTSMISVSVDKVTTVMKLDPIEDELGNEHIIREVDNNRVQSGIVVDLEVPQLNASNSDSDTVTNKLEPVCNNEFEPKAEQNSSRFECYVCNKTVLSEEELQKHSKEHTKVCPHSCSQCSRSFTSEKRLNQHLRAHKLQMSFTCDVCGKSFKWKSKLTKHQKIHLPNRKPEERKFKCTLCDKAYSRKTCLDVHMCSHTKTRPHRCDKCGKTFINKGDLREHKFKHVADDPTRIIKPCVCTVCSKGYSSKKELKRHMRIHLGEQPYKCQFCDKVYNHTSSLKSHIAGKHTIQRHTCQVCSKSFLRHDYYLKHCKIHSGEAVFKCEQCSRTFTEDRHLRRHILASHTDIRPYKCDKCFRGFLEQHLLKLHLRTHSSEKPFKCLQCDKAFRQPVQLKYHMNSHAGVHPYVCDKCGKSYTNPSGLHNHLQNHDLKMEKRDAKKIKCLLKVRKRKKRRHHYSCSRCDKTFKSKFHFSQHFKHIHEKDDFEVELKNYQ